MYACISIHNEQLKFINRFTIMCNFNVWDCCCEKRPHEYYIQLQTTGEKMVVYINMSLHTDEFLRPVISSYSLQTMA